MRSRLLRHALPWMLTWVLMVVFINFLFPAILNSRLLFGGLVVLLLVGGLVSAVVSARRMFRR